MKSYTFSRTALIADILKNAKSLGIPSGSAKIFAEKNADQVETWLKKHPKITEADLYRVVAKHLSVYSKDLSFFYKNRDKII